MGQIPPDLSSKIQVVNEKTIQAINDKVQVRSHQTPSNTPWAALDGSCQSQLGVAREPKAEVYCPAIERELSEINKCLRLAWSKTGAERTTLLVEIRAFA